MRLAPSVAAAALGVAAWLSPAYAQPVKPEDRNAALLYLTAFQMGTRDVERRFASSLLDMSSVGFDGAVAPQEFTELAELAETNGQTNIGRFIEASRLARCDFEIDWSPGPATILAHLRVMSLGSKLLCFDARRLAMAGDAEGAAERLAATIRMSHHVTGDGAMISSWVALSMCRRALDETEAELGASKLTPGARAKVLAALNTLDVADPFALRAGIQGEARYTLEWAKATLRGPKAGRALVDAAGLEFGAGVVEAPGGAPKAPGANPGEPKPPPPRQPKMSSEAAVEAIGRMNETELAAAVELAGTYFDRVMEAWNEPDAVERLKALEVRNADGEFGPVSRSLGPTVSNSRRRMNETVERIAALKEKLATK